MDFFSAQDKARRNTLRLVLLFVTAVISLVVLTNLLIAVFLLYFTDYGNYSSVPMPERALSTDDWVSISLGVLVIISGASLYKYMMVKGGGRAVAESLGGKQLDPNTASLSQRRLLNVVEEMAIAAGIPVPAVYLVPDSAINAFAAGFSIDDAVIGVTQGTVELLNRDELQGVIGHEFSHLLNGDTRINLRLIAILHGILFIGIIGHMLLRSGTYRSWNVGSRRSSNNSAPLMLLGVGLLVIGYAGTFFGNLIKAAVSRQREFLADAASVQFTRNPLGIANALKKIGGYSEGSLLHEAKAEEYSHMFFGQGVKLFLNRLMATHPPLGVRIRAVEPAWDGKFPHIERLAASEGQPSSELTATSDTAPEAAFDVKSKSGLVSNIIEVEPADTARVVSQTVDVTANAGQPSAAHLETARRLIGATGEICQEAAHDPWGARALLYAMLIQDDRRAMELVHRQAEAGVPEYMEKLKTCVAGLDFQRKLTLLSMAIPALKRLSLEQYRLFIGNLIEVIKADQKIELFEWVLHRILLKELKPHFEQVTHPRIRYTRLQPLSQEVGELLSSLARLHGDDAKARAAFQHGCRVAGIETDYVSAPDPNFTRLNHALSELRQLKPLAKPKLLKACAATLSPEGDSSATGITKAEARQAQLALLQGVAATLDCPLPPMLSE